MAILRSTNIDSELCLDDLVYVPPERVKDEQYVKAGDIVICMSSGSKHLVGKAAQANTDFPGGFGAFCGLVRASGLTDRRYIGAFFHSPNYRNAVSQLSMGVNINNLRRDHLESMVIPLAPVAEQRRIVAKMEELFSQLDAGIAALEKAKAQLHRYRQAVLKAAVTGELTREWREAHKDQLEPASVLLGRILEERRARWEADQLERMAAKGKLPKDDGWKHRYDEPPSADTDGLPSLPDTWAAASVGQISAFMQYGTSQKADLDTSGIPVLRMGNVQQGKLTFEDLKYLPADYAKQQDFLLQPGDVLFNRTNSAQLVGKTAVYKSSHPTSAFASYLIRIRMHAGCLPDFVAFYINSHYGREYIASVVSQQVGQANVSARKLARMPVALPCTAEQRLTVAEVEERLSVVEALAKAAEDGLTRAERLREAILKRAFEGRLVPQDPTDEPASVLLERITAEKAGREADTKHVRKQRQKKEPDQHTLFT